MWLQTITRFFVVNEFRFATTKRHHPDSARAIAVFNSGHISDRFPVRGYRWLKIVSRAGHDLRYLARIQIQAKDIQATVAPTDKIQALSVSTPVGREIQFRICRQSFNGAAHCIDNADLKIALRRVKDTPSFSMLGASERGKLIKKAFRTVPGVDVRKKRVLLVDDVVTTGATTNECARVLRRAGAQRVDVLTVAVAKRLS